MAGPLLKLPRGSADRGSVVFAVILHAVGFALLSSVLALPVLRLARAERARPLIEERVTFIQQAPVERERARDSVRPPRAPPAQRRDTSSSPPPAAVPPIAGVTSVLVPPDSGVVPPATSRVGADSVAGRDGGGGMSGLRPGPKDPRLLGIGIPDRNFVDSTLVANMRTPDSMVRGWIQAYWDSVARAQAAPARRPGDWTVDRNGEKYGADPAFIYFGKFKLPTALLALLPIKTTANPSILDRRRALESMRWEIEYQALRSVNQISFQDAVKALRARKDAEHAARAKR